MLRETGIVSGAGAAALCALAVCLMMSGCARGGEGGPVVPAQVMDILLRFAGPINDAFYYFIAVDADDDVNDGPIPVASGPYWGNGWGTGSMTHYVEYHQGIYQLYRVILAAELRRAGGGIVQVQGTPVTTDAGAYTLTISSIQFGQAAVTGAGMIGAVTNTGDQNAGTLTVATDAAGNVVGGSVTFTPAADGGRPLTAAEQQQLDAVNGGGQPLAPDTFAFLGLDLQLGAPAAGQQTITIAPAVGNVTVNYVGTSPPQQTRSWTGTLTANSATPTANPPIPGLTIRTEDLVQGDSAEIGLVPAETGILIGTPYDFVVPSGTNTLRVTIDLSRVAPDIQFMALNFISTTQLIFDPQATDIDNVFDALGPRGNDYITLRLGEYGTYRNGDGWVKEGADDPTLEGPASEQDKASVDLVDWQVTVRRL